VRSFSLPTTVALALLASACSKQPESAPPAPTPVRAATAFEGPAAPAIRTNGLLANKDEMRLSFKVGGVIRKLTVREGEHVRKGQRLAEIEQTEINAQVEQARQANEKSKRDAERGERLYADKVISLEQLQDLKTQTAVTDAALNSAEFNWNYAAIVASRDGTVLRRLAEERELVAAGTPVLVLGAQDRGFVVRAGLADRDIVQVKLGDVAQVRLDALPGQTLSGKVTEVASAADSASGMFMIEVAVEAREQPLKSGLVAKLDITPASAGASSLIYVPISAVVEGNGNRLSVFVVDHDHARRREVEMAFVADRGVALVGGVALGEQVVTDGAKYLEDGEQIAVEATSNSSGDADLTGSAGRPQSYLAVR
jgi:multidrug efflux system membrane fusion protein